MRETARPDSGPNVAEVRLAALFSFFGPLVFLVLATLLLAHRPVREWPVGVTAVISCLGPGVVAAARLAGYWARRTGAAPYLGVARSAEVLRGLRSRRTAIEAEERRRYGHEATRLDRRAGRYLFACKTLVDGFALSFFAYIGICDLNRTAANACLLLAAVFVCAGGVAGLTGLRDVKEAQAAAARALGLFIA